MNKYYGNNKIKKQLSSATEIKKAFGTMAKKVSTRLDDIDASPSLSTLMQLHAANCHPLTGDKRGEWALDVSGNFRMIFEIAHDPVPEKADGGIDTDLITEITIIKIEDYH